MNWSFQGPRPTLHPPLFAPGTVHQQDVPIRQMYYQQRRSPAGHPLQTSPSRHTVGPDMKIHAPQPHLPARRAPRNLVRPQPQPQPQPQNPSIMGFLDTTVRGCAERIQMELTNLRNMCTRAVFREQQEKEKWRSHCITFMKQRDLARERVRVLIAQREKDNIVRFDEGRGPGAAPEVGDMPDEQSRIFDARSPSSPSSSPRRLMSPAPIIAVPDDNDDLTPFNLTYPLPPITLPSPPRPMLPISTSPPIRALKRSRSTEDTTVFDITVLNTTGERIPNTKRKRMSLSSETSEGSSRTLVGGPKVAGSPGLGEGDMELESDNGSEVQEVDASGERPQLFRPSPRPPSPKPAPQIEVTHVDIMYIPKDGRLVCRVCLLCPPPVTLATPPFHPKTFPTNAPWNVLRDHCATEHPTACADVARLHPAEVYELRRRLALSSM